MPAVQLEYNVRHSAAHGNGPGIRRVGGRGDGERHVAFRDMREMEPALRIGFGFLAFAREIAARRNGGAGDGLIVLVDDHAANFGSRQKNNFQGFRAELFFNNRAGANDKIRL